MRRGYERENGEDDRIENRRKRNEAKGKGKNKERGKMGDKMEEYIGKERKWVVQRGTRRKMRDK